MYRKRKNMIKSIALCFLFTFMILSLNISSYAEEVTSHPVKVKQVIVVEQTKGCLSLYYEGRRLKYPPSRGKKGYL